MIGVVFVAMGIVAGTITAATGDIVSGIIIIVMMGALGVWFTWDELS